MEFELFKVEAGWAYVRLVVGSDQIIVTGSYTPVDILRDFVDNVASLGSFRSVHCCWTQQPGELHWQFLRSGDNLKISILEFPAVKVPCKHGSEGKTVFEAQVNWLEFARQVFISFRSIENSMGVAGYERQWRYQFPREACQKLERAIQMTSKSLGKAL